MDYDPQNDSRRHYSQNNNEENLSSYPSFQDIFRHSWPILWEKPVNLLCFVLFIVLLDFGVDYLSNLLFAPYVPVFNDIFSRNDTLSDQELQKTIDLLKNQYGTLRLIAAIFLPVLLFPFISYTISRGALSMWDGYSPSIRDIVKALFGYFKAFILTIILFIVGIVLSFATFLFCLPCLLILKLQNSSVYFTFLVILTIISLVLWIRYIWPYARRYFFLQFFMFFHMADHPGLTNILKTTYTVAEDLKPWTSHLNSMFGISILVFIGLMVPLQFILEIFKNVEPQFPITIIVNTIMIFFSFWPLVAIAGFYRICLYPRSEIPTPSYEKPKK